MLQVQSPFQQFFDLDGSPLENGEIYIGAAGENPETNPLSVYWDDGLTIPAAQPIRIVSGYVVRYGTPARLYTSQEDYSLTVRNKLKSIVFSVLNATSLSNLQSQLASGTGSSLVGFVAVGSGAQPRTVLSKLRDFATINDFGGSPAAGSIINDGAIVSSITEIGYAYIPDGEYSVTTASVPNFKNLRGPGYIKIGLDLYPAGDVVSALTLPVPSVFADVYAATDYLSTRRLFAATTIEFDTGLFNYTDNICPTHRDGALLSIVGQGSGSTVLKFDFTGKEGLGTGAVVLKGQWQIGLVDKMTLDGSNWSGRTGGPPATNSGDPSDPIGVLARDGAVIKLGPDVVVTYMARNGILTYTNSTIYADGVTVSNCGSDGFVASTASSTICNGAISDGNYGFGYYADYGGIIWANNSQAVDTLKRNGTGGGGYASNYGGVIHASNSQSLRNAQDGYLCLAGTIHIDDAISGGSAIEANAQDGLRCQAGGMAYATGFSANYNTRNGVNLAQGGGFFGGTLSASNNGSDGVYVGAGGFMESSGATTSANGRDGVRAEFAAAVNIPNITADSNVGNGLNSVGSYIAGSVATSIKNNGAFGVLSRFSGIVDLRSTASGTAITGNTSGAASPTVNTTTGTVDSFIYTLS